MMALLDKLLANILLVAAIYAVGALTGGLVVKLAKWGLGLLSKLVGGVMKLK